MIKKYWQVKPGDCVRSGIWSGNEAYEYGEVLAVLPVPGRDWPGVVVVLPGGRGDVAAKGRKSKFDCSRTNWSGLTAPSLLFT